MTQASAPRPEASLAVRNQWARATIVTIQARNNAGFVATISERLGGARA
jgi:hypothetical protein